MLLTPMRLIIKRAVYLFFMTMFLFSCKSKDPIVPVDPDENKEVVTLKYISQNIIAFKSIESSGESTILNASKIEEYFGTRVESFIPTEVLIKKDSVFLTKKGGLKEGFSAKWENDNKLYVYNDFDKSWTLLGEKNNEVFHLKTGFYRQKHQRNSRTSMSLGQEYALDNYDVLLKDQTAYNLVWLRIDSFYK